MKHCISIAKLFNWSTFMCIYIQHKLFSLWLNYSIEVLTLKMGSIAVLVLYLKLKLNLQVYNIWMGLNYENTKMIGGTQFSIYSPIILFLKKFWWTHVHLSGHWYSCFGLLVTCPLSFKARVRILIRTWPIILLRQLNTLRSIKENRKILFYQEHKIILFIKRWTKMT